MASDTHLVRKQCIHVESDGTESEGFLLQRRLSELCHARLTPALARLLDRYSPPDAHAMIEHLEIDAGIVSLERLEEDFAESVLQAIDASLQQTLRSGGSSEQSGSTNVQRKGAQEWLADAFSHFLATGRLPWSFRLPEGQDLETAILNSWRGTGAPSATDRLGDAAILRTLASTVAQERLVRQFSSLFLEALLARLSPEVAAVVAGIMRVVKNPSIPISGVKHFERQIWKTAFARVARNSAPAAADLVDETWHRLPPRMEEQAVLASILTDHWPDALRSVPAKGVKSMEGQPPDRPPHQPHPADRATANHVANGLESPDLLPAVERIQRGWDERHVLNEGLYLHNAGLVLLHPFLPRFFEALGIASDETLVQPERALCLLHFLATGQRAAPEYELLLPKLLCDVPLEMPVESMIELTVAEEDEAAALLDAVVRHWEALRDTSADSLRGTFLTRHGKLSQRDDGDYLLQVEKQSFDILLDQLPWGIGIVKLPWMRKMLWVEWR